MSEARGLPIWTIYDHPSDFPHCYVARLFIGIEATSEAIIAPTLEDIRAAMRNMGLARLDRMPGDDPRIVETWL